MKKLFAFMLVAMLVLGSVGVVGGVSSWVAGNDVIDRATGPDSWTNFYLADGNNAFAEDTVMTGWSAYVKRLSSFYFVVFTPVNDGWQVTYQSEIVVPTALGVLTREIQPQLIPAGSYVGLYYPGNGAVPYAVTGTAHQSGILTRAVLFTDNNNGATFVDFYGSGDRVYSIQAHGYVAPVATAVWLPPISLDQFALNERATLPIKFKLDGEYADVTLTVGGQDIPLKYEWDEEYGDFYIGLFRPDSAGDFTAEILVGGVSVLDRTFNVYEVAPNGNGRGRK